MENRYKVDYDIKHKCTNNVRFMQSDIDTSVLEITLYDNGTQIDMTGETLEFRFLKPDNTVVFQDASSGVSIINATQGNFQCILKGNTLASVGVVRCEIIRKKNGLILTCPAFNFTVGSSIGGIFLSTNYIASIENKIIEWQKDEELRQKVFENNESVRKNTFTTNEVSRQDTFNVNETTRQNVFDTNEAKRKASMLNVEDRFSKLTTAQQNNAEVVDARTSSTKKKTFNDLNERFEDIEDRVQSRDYTEIETKGASIVSLPNAVEGQGKIVEIQGNTLVNLVQNGNFSNGTTGWGWSNSDNIVSVSNNEITYTATAQYAGFSQSISNYANYANHKLYYRALVNPTIDSVGVYLVLNDGVDQGVARSGVENQYTLLSEIRTVTSNPKTLFIKIQDGRVANWTPIKAKEFMVVDLTAMYGAGNEPTKEVCDTIQWFDGMKSVDRIEVLSRGRNLIKNSNEISILPNNVGLGIATKMNDETVPYWRVKATSIVSTYENVIYDYMSSNATVGKEYTISCDVRIPNTGNVGFFNEFGVNFNIPANTWTRIFYTFTYSCKTHRVGGHVYNGTQLDYRNWQLEEGTTSRPYTQDQEDKINILTSKSLKKWDKASGDTVSWGTSEKVLESSDITLMYSVTNLDWACINKPIDGKDSNQYTLSALLQGCTCGNASDNVSNIGSLAGDGNITSYFVGFPKGTTLEQAKNFLVGKKLIYQLATPIIEKLPKPLTLSSFENGSLFIDSNIPCNVKYAYPTNLSSAVASLRDYTEVLEQQMLGVWKTSLGLADRELRMKAVPLLATETTTDLKNKVNEILSIWR